MDASASDSIVSTPAASEAASGGECRQKPGVTLTVAARQKKWAPKTKTGCLTCRQRKIKCDERKPVCAKCTSTGRRCAGYGYIPSMYWRQQLSTAALIPQPNQLVGPFKTPPENQESQMFTLFCQQVIPKHQDVFDIDFWSTIGQASQVYPAVWHASLALAGAHKQQQIALETTNSSSDTMMARSLQRANYEFSLQQYSKCIRCLTQINGPAIEPADQEMLLMTCTLLANYCNMAAEPTEALTHVKNGMQLFKQWKYWQHSSDLSSTTRPRNCVAPVASIIMPFMRSEVQALHQADRVPEPLHDISLNSALIDANTPFKSTTEAYLALMPIFFFSSWGWLERSQSLSLVSQDDEDKSCRKYLPMFQMWKTKFGAFTAFRQRHKPKEDDDIDPLDNIRLTALQLFELLGDVIFYLDTSKEELAWDDFTAKFYKIVDICENFLERAYRTRLRSKQVESHVSSFLSRASPVLRMVARSCRHPQIRRRALEILKAHPYQDGIFTSDVNAQVAAILMQVEQDGAVMSPLKGGCDCISDEFVCNSHRLVWISVQPSQDGKASLHVKSLHQVRNGLPATRAILGNSP